MTRFDFDFLRTIRQIGACIVLWLCVGVALGQTGSPTFDLTHTVTTGSCIVSPSLTLKVENSTFPENTTYQYTLYNLTTHTDGQPLRTTALTATFENLTAGTYRAEVLVLSGTSVTKHIDNIVIGNPYKSIVVEMDVVNSRNLSYPCGTAGNLRFVIKYGSGAYRIRVVEGPMHAGEYINYTTVGTDVYQLEGDNWLPGTYKIGVSDACNAETTQEMIIKETTSMPNVRAYWSQVPRIDEVVNPSCSRIYTKTDYDTPSDAKERMYTQNIGQWFEIGVKYPWLSDDEVVWHPFQDFYEETSLDYYEMARRYTSSVPIQATVRLKQCPNIKTTLSRNLIFDSDFRVYEILYSCTTGLYLNLSYSYLSMYCYPLTVRLYDVTDSNRLLGETVVNSRSGGQRNTNAEFYNIPLANFLATKNATIKAEATDAQGRTSSGIIGLSIKAYNYVLENKSICGVVDYTKGLYFGLSYNHGGSSNFLRMNCPVSAVVTEADGTAVGQYRATGEVKIEHLTFGKTYYYTLSVDGTDLVESGSFVHYPSAVSSRRITSSLMRADPNRIDFTSIQFVIEGTIGAGSIAQMTGPDGRVWKRVFTSGSSDTYHQYSMLGTYSNEGYTRPIAANLPAGKYEFDLYNTCDGQHYLYTHMHKPGYGVNNFRYEIEYICGGAIIKPYADVYCFGSKLSTSEYFFFVHPKAMKVENKMVSQGGAIRLSGEGDYVLSVGVYGDGGWSRLDYNGMVARLSNPDSTDRRLMDIPVEVKIPSLTIDPDRSMAYVCGSDVDGEIYLQAKGGVPPYTYELYTDESVSTPAMKNGQAVVARGVNSAHFQYGRMNEVVYAKIFDKCGNSYIQRIPLINVTDISAAYAFPDTVCEGSSLSLRFIGPEILKEQMVARWYDPHGQQIASHRSELTLANATSAMSGRYKVMFTLPGCGVEVTNYVNVHVAEGFRVEEPPTYEYTVCLGKPVDVEGMRTQTANVKSQWHLAERQEVDYLALLLGETDAYLYKWRSDGLYGDTSQRIYKGVFVKAGTYVLQHTLTNGCTTESAPIFVRVKACTVPLNPHLMHRPVVNWNLFNHLPTKMAQ